MKKRLPIGIQTFREIREEGCYYVDKTAYARRLIHDVKHYFLSRPRRFGKSLFLDTLKELFEGSEALFEGLAIHEHWDWSVRHPVVRLDFSGESFREPGGLRANLMEQLDAIERAVSVERRYDTAPGRFRHLLQTLHQRSGQRVVVLVDEYDKPILDALHTPDLAEDNRDALRGLYSNLKFCDAHVKLSMLAGVGKFTKGSLFSDLNNLIDITLDPSYSALCGYTDADLDDVFAPELPGLDREAIREWYDGYSWRGEERVYNPFDVLLLFRNREFRAWWFETGTPTFLVETLLRRGMTALDLEDAAGSEELLSSFDVHRIEPEALLFQTGYLTIHSAEWRRGRTYYRLRYPNRKVRQSLKDSLLRAMVPKPEREIDRGVDRLHALLSAGDFAGVKELFQALYASIPHQWYTNNEIARYEGYYAAVFYAYFAGLEEAITVEDSDSRGRLDMAVRTGGRVYLFEFKVVEQAGEGAALAQLREKGYADKYRALGEPIHLVGVEFSSEQRNVTAFETERA